ncbi:non-canonical purine NTP pyrophosphatase [Mesorhizobium australicum]|uniref:non-canonical purine NTP pyrophosphatase n=1 Tax=Mesorhizobium australicum TaxID=536018 RepID=UPI00333A9F90
MRRRTIYYATRSTFKNEELDIISREHTFVDLRRTERSIGELIEFKVSRIPTEEPLEIDLSAMVRHKARSAYRTILAPCIVEHAGLILEKNQHEGFPGGLTQPMWDALEPEGFLARTGCAGERAIARAVVGYCDGKQTHTFVGETTGIIARAPRGSREFYWDVVFCPDDGSGMTYAEMSDQPGGLQKKLAMSQSTKAISAFASFLATQNGNGLFE